MAYGLDARLLDHLAATKLFDPPGLALLAVSGGPDSVALVDLMCCVGEELELGLAIAHIFHGISAESAQVVPQVRQLAGRYGIPFYMEELALGSAATETMARQARYGALRSIQKRVGASYLVTAHHRDDQVETVLFRFLRGSGVAGLAGIPAAGPDGLVRPLLPFGGAELEKWLLHGFPDPETRPPLFDDPANADVRHDRSWLRHRLLPLLRERFGPTLDQCLVGAGEHAERENRAWAALLETLPDLHFRCDRNSVEVARAPLRRYDKLLSETILRAAARKVGCRLGRKHATLLLDFAIESSSGRSIRLGSGWEATLVFETLRIFRMEQKESPSVVRVEFVEGGEGRFTWGRWQFDWWSRFAGSSRRDSQTTWVMHGPCDVRAPMVGDRILPLGGVGSRKVRRLLMEARVPASERDGFPIVVRGTDVLWVPGICRSAKAVPDVGDLAVRLEARAR